MANELPEPSGEEGGDAGERSRPSVTLESLTPEIFGPLVGDVFQVEYLAFETEQTHVRPRSGGDLPAVDSPELITLELVEVTRYPRIREREGGFDHRMREPFSLLFEGRGDDPPLLSALHTVHHVQLGSLRLFLNPVQVALMPELDAPSPRFYETVVS